MRAERDVDADYADYVQGLADAFADGRRVGAMGLGAGLCPHGYSNEERAEWVRGFGVGAASLLVDRKAA